MELYFRLLYCKNTIHFWCSLCTTKCQLAAIRNPSSITDWCSYCELFIIAPPVTCDTRLVSILRWAILPSVFLRVLQSNCATLQWHIHPLILSRPSAAYVLSCPLNNLVQFCCFCAISSSRECLILFRLNPFLRVTESQLFICLLSCSKATAVTPLHVPINDTRCWGTVQNYSYSSGVAKLPWHLKVKHMCVYKLWPPSPTSFSDQF